jgi:hypothetical protein
VAGGSRPLVAAVVALALAQPAAGQELRVLLFETRGATRSRASESRRRQRACASTAARRQALGAPGPGPHRAGDQWVRGSVAVERRGRACA